MTAEFTIGQLASEAGVNIQTLRYYERRRLLRPPARSSAGHRRYPARSLAILIMIKSAQQLGFTLDEIAVLMAASSTHGHQDRVFAELVAQRVIDIDTKTSELTRTRRRLVAYTSSN